MYWLSTNFYPSLWPNKKNSKDIGKVINEIINGQNLSKFTELGTIIKLKVYPKAKIHGNRVVISFYIKLIFTTSLPKRWENLGIEQCFINHHFDVQNATINPNIVMITPIGKTAA